MIIVDRKSKTVLELVNNQLNSFKGDQDQILSVVEKHYKPLTPIINTYISYFPCSNIVDYDRALRIVSIIHKKVFIVNPLLFKKIGVESILGRLLGFNKKTLNKIHQTYDISLFGDVSYPKFSVAKIDNMDDLLKYAIVTRSYRVGPLRRATSWITLEYIRNRRHKNWLNASVGSGIGVTKKIAIAKSVSEVLERFSAGVVDKPKDYTVVPVEDHINKLLMGDYVLQKTDVLYPITNLFDKKLYTIPGNILFYPYPPHPVWDTSSNGMSCHITKLKAIENALFELIERDAFVLSWLLKSGIYRIEKNKKIDNLIKKTDIKDFDVQFFVLRFDNPIPVVLTITRDGRKISSSVGVGCTLDEAIEKSLDESGQFGKQNIEAEPELEPDESSIRMHIKEYLNEENFYKVAWYYDLPSISIESAKKLFQKVDNVKQLVDRYYSSGTNLYGYQYKNPLLAYNKRYCMRVISDNLLHIWFGEVVPSSILNSDRLRYRKEKLRIQSLNTEIHPFG